MTTEMGVVSESLPRKYILVRCLVCGLQAWAKDEQEAKMTKCGKCKEPLWI